MTNDKAPRCTYGFCYNEAEYIDHMDDHICADCMDREIQEGSAEPEDFEAI